MFKRLWLWMILIVSGLAAPLPEAPPKGPNEVFVAVLSHFPNADEVEKKLYTYLGQLPGIDYILQPDTAQELFAQLAKVTQKGKKIRYLVIAGHGAAADPHITFRTDQLTASHVDVATFETQLAKSLKLNESENNEYDNVDREWASNRIDNALTFRQENRQRLADLNAAADGMAEGAVVLLLNCSAGATPQARAMSQGLGEALLSQGGGTMVVSTSDIEIDQALASLSLAAIVRTRKWVSAGDYWTSGNWMRMDIPKKPRKFLFSAFHPTALAEAEVGQIVKMRLTTDAYRSGGRLLYYWNNNPIGTPEPEFKLCVVDNPSHRIDVDVKVKDQAGRVASDRFTVRIAMKVRVPSLLNGETGTPIRVKAVPEGGSPPYRYEWMLGGRPTDQHQQTSDWRFAEPGRYLLTARVTDSRESRRAGETIVQVKTSSTRAPSFQGVWRGPYNNSRNEPGQTTVQLTEAQGKVTGTDDGLTILDGRRNGNTMTWRLEKDGGFAKGGCTWNVTVQILDDGNTLVQKYTGRDHRTEKNDGGYYTGQSTLRR